MLGFSIVVVIALVFFMVVFTSYALERVVQAVGLALQVCIVFIIVGAFVWAVMGTSPCDDFYSEGLYTVMQCYKGGE